MDVVQKLKNIPACATTRNIEETAYIMVGAVAKEAATEIELLRAKVVELEAHNDEYCRAYVEEHQDTVKELLAIKTTQAEQIKALETSYRQAAQEATQHYLRTERQAAQIKLAREALDMCRAIGDWTELHAHVRKALDALDSAEYENISPK